MSLHHPFAYLRAGSVEEALAALASHGDAARPIAGGTVVAAMIRHRMMEPDVLVGLEGIPGLGDISAIGDGLVIGALATHHDVSRSPDVRRVAPVLARACGRVASPAIRSMGTLGGNVCHAEPASDPGPALLALGARMQIRGPGGSRAVAAADFYLGFYETALGMGELLMAVEVDPPPPGSRSAYLKWTPRAREDKPLVGLAAVVTLADGGCTHARLAAGGVGDRPWLLQAASSVLTGAELTGAVIEEAAEAAAAEIEPVEDVQASGEYRRDMLRLWTRRTLQQLAAGGDL